MNRLWTWIKVVLIPFALLILALAGVGAFVLYYIITEILPSMKH